MTWPTFGWGVVSYSAELLKGTSYTAELEQSASVKEEYLIQPLHHAEFSTSLRQRHGTYLGSWRRSRCLWI